MNSEEKKMPIESWRRAEEIFRLDLKTCQVSTARLFGLLLCIEWLAVISAALIISPYTWSGTSSTFHIHLYFAIAMGGLLCVFPVIFIKIAPERPLTQYTIVISQIMFSSLLIHLTGGRIETHFHVFGSLAFIAFFRDPKLLISATFVVAVDHFVRGIYWPQSVYGVLTAAPWRTLEHVAWVVFEDIFLLYAIRQHRKEMLATAERQAALESTNEIIDQEVRRRTAELEVMAKDLANARDEALASVKAKGEFLANMSHEIRTPLNAIIGFGDLLAESEEVSESEKETIGIINISAHHLLNIINDILDFSKLDQGRMVLSPTAVEFRPFIESCLKIFTQQLEVKEISCILKISDVIPKVLVFDPVRMRQIITNIVGNAIKFTPDSGAVVLKFDVRKIENEFLTLRGNVIDSGIGIAAENQSKIFEAFEQADASHTRRFGGSGLGLAITSQLLQQMGGEITVSSKEGVGTCFGFSFQVEMANVASERDASRNKSAIASAIDNRKGASSVFSKSNKQQHRATILVAEDNVMNQRLIQLLLEKCGYDATVVSDGSKAVECFKKGAFDLVLLDIQMPVMSGVEAMHQIREWQSLNEVSKPTPIIALSAHAMPEDNEHYIAEGMDGYLTKPIDRKQLFEEIERHLGRTAEGIQ